MDTLVKVEQNSTDVAFANNGYRKFKTVKRRNYIQENFEVPLMVRILKIPKHQRILEIGCGQGIALTPLFYRCHPTRLVGIDIDHRLLRRAERRLKIREVPAELYQEDVRLMSFADGSFDLVIDFGTCYHVTQSDKAVKEIARVLSPGGMFIFETKLNQLLSHPVRAFTKAISWKAANELKTRRNAIMWASRRKSLTDVNNLYTA